MRPHRTDSACRVGDESKLGLGSFSGPPSEQVAKAAMKCQRFGLPILSDSDPRTLALEG